MAALGRTRRRKDLMHASVNQGIQNYEESLTNRPRLPNLCSSTNELPHGSIFNVLPNDQGVINDLSCQGI